MKTNYILLTLLLVFFNSCVQKTYKRTVVFTVDVSKIKNINSVGIRGEKPLNWNYDTQMNALKKDSLYTITQTFETGYRFVEVKFTVNGNYELENLPNRRVYFNKKGKTVYKAIFNKP